MHPQIKNSKIKLQVLCLSIICCMFANYSYAAYTLVAPSSSTEIIVASIQNNAPVWLNDAVSITQNGTIYAEVWDEGSNSMYIEVHDYLGNSVGVIPLAAPLVALGYTCTHPDVIIGGNYVGIVYNGDNAGVKNIYMEVYTVTGVGSASIALTSCTTYIYQIGNSGLAGDAHIDLANIAVTVTSIPYMFAIAWEDGIAACAVSATRPGARACVGSLSTLANCATPAFTFAPSCLNFTTGPSAAAGSQVDIALTGTATGVYTATFTYQDWANTSSLYSGTWTVGGTLTQGTAAVTNTTNEIRWPRIDAYDYNTGAGTARVDVVYQYKDNSVWNIVQLNNLIPLTPDEASAYYNVGTCTYNTDNSKPVVTAGTGSKKLYYSLAYANTSLDEVMEQNVDVATGNLFLLPSVNYRIANNFANISDPVAISNDYQIVSPGVLLPDQIYLCWYNTNSQTIDGKARSSTTVPVFKQAQGTTNVNTANAQNQHVEVYPIPASNKVYIDSKGMSTASYTITDVMGRIIMKGQIDKDVQDVDITGIAQGLYLLNVSYKNGIDVDGVKIVKE